MKSPLEGPDGNWWDEKVNRRETIWLGISGAWALGLFGWMSGWTQFGNQNPIGESLDVSTEQFQEKVTDYKSRAGAAEAGLVPPGTDIYVGAARYAFDGLPVVLEKGTEYTFHLGTYDVQHGFSVRLEDTLSKQMSLQMLPGYEWLVPMSFDETGTYHVVCNEFCGEGHRTMHSTFEVRDSLPDVEMGTGTDGSEDGQYDGYLSNADNFDGEPVDETGSDSVTIRVGAEGNGGGFAFAPPAVQVDTGTTVTWEWTGEGGQHNVVAEAGADFESELTGEAGFTFERTFEESGAVKYFCRPHKSLGMKGVVEVL
jgi:halocyanin-like protein